MGHRVPVQALVALAALVAASAAGCGERAPPPGRARNLVVVVLDTLRPDHLGLHGYGRPTSPRLDGLAAQSAVFEGAQASSPWTAPSLVSLMTSLHPQVHGVLDFPHPARMPAAATTLAELLRARGYTTGAFTEGGFAKRGFGLGEGFDVYPDFAGDAGTNAANLYQPSRLDENLDRAESWLREHHRRPFFLFFHSYQVHAPYSAPAEHVSAVVPGYDGEAEHALLAEAVARWNAERVLERDQARRIVAHSLHCDLAGLPPLADQPALGRLLVRLGLELEPRTRPVDAELLAFARDQYDAEIHYTDARLARLLDLLDELGHRDDTLLVVVSDHGEAFGERGLTGHGKVLHDELLRVLLLVRGPGIVPQRVATQVRLIDVMPTALELLAVEPGPAPLQGASLAPLLAGARPDASAPLAFAQGVSVPGEERMWSSVRSERHRYVERAGEPIGLFDLAVDPGATRDVAAEQPEVVAHLRAALAAQRAKDAALRATLGAATPRAPDEDTLRELRALGYAGAGPLR